jgi:hypothetical protein
MIQRGRRQMKAAAIALAMVVFAIGLGLDPTVVSPAAKSTSGPEAELQRQSPSKRLPATRV